MAKPGPRLNKSARAKTSGLILICAALLLTACGGPKLEALPADATILAFGDILTDDEITAVAAYVGGLAGGVSGDHPGAEVFADNCAACHGEDGKGDRSQGAPNLADAIWLWGGDQETIEATVRYSRFGQMPPWTGRLSEAEIRQVAVYVHGLGGGEATPE